MFCIVAFFTFIVVVVVIVADSKLSANHLWTTEGQQGLSVAGLGRKHPLLPLAAFGQAKVLIIICK